MCYQKFSPLLIKISVVLLLLAGCSAPAAAPVPPTEIPPTPTAVPATEIPPSPTAVPPMEIPPSPTPVPPTEIPPSPTAHVLITSAEILIGSWQPLSKSQDATFIQINADGTCSQAYELDGLTDTPQVECTYTFEEGFLLITAVKLNGVPECQPPTARYEVQLLADDLIQLVPIKDPCTPRVRSTRGEYQRIP
jgi:hypothetical protein